MNGVGVAPHAAVVKPRVRRFASVVLSSSSAPRNAARESIGYVGACRRHPGLEAQSPVPLRLLRPIPNKSPLRLSPTSLLSPAGDWRASYATLRPTTSPR